MVLSAAPTGAPLVTSGIKNIGSAGGAVVGCEKSHEKLMFFAHSVFVSTSSAQKH